MRLWWGAGLVVCTWPISCAVKGSPCAVLNAAAVWVALGFGIVIQGVACDVESMEYSYQFSDGLQQDWQWSERYSAQPEILAYAEACRASF